ncbi:MAG: type II toxin-antitoxin system RatA family toxin [Burkholderiales bacterium]|jgi:ribosome-associated toxin RatA of RatAB toxin-antitoxin module|nr:type II toxin-antitoxin system RatA family toxin [Burkholderiales bacterium]
MKVERSALVGYTAREMFALVEDIERYPEFLPWCSGTTVSLRTPEKTNASIQVNYRGVRQSFSTENLKQAPEKMTMKLVEGPFRILDGEWRFTPLTDSACRIDFSLHYEFSSRLLERIAGPVFGHIAGTMMEAFLKRAEQLHGKR